MSEIGTYPLQDVAKAAGGRQAAFRQHHPNVPVIILGLCTHVVYETDKKEDGLSQYIHEFGEESGIRPILTCDKQGRVWLAGGNYTVPPEGITD